MNDAPLLCIETSGQSLGVALRAECGLLFAEDCIAEAVHGRGLAPLIEKALASVRLQPEQLLAVAVSIGPGSWTGLRIGLSAAKALAWGLGKPLVPVKTFEALALAARKKTPSHAVLCLRDARSEGWFGALFSETSAVPERWIEECVLQPDAFVNAVSQALANRKQTRLTVCGDPPCLAGFEKAAVASGLEYRLAECQHVPAWALADAAWQAWLAGNVLRETGIIHSLSPLYLRPSGPELKLVRAGG